MAQLKFAFSTRAALVAEKIGFTLPDVPKADTSLLLGDTVYFPGTDIPFEIIHRYHLFSAQGGETTLVIVIELARRNPLEAHAPSDGIG